MYDTFHYFSYLPWELRDAIWKFALRPAVPGVHIFALYSNENDKGGEETIGLVDPVDARRRGPLRLAEPRSKNLPKSLTRICNNPSTYLIDGGLWTACKESRLVMEKNFQAKWKSPSRDPFEPIRKTEWFSGSEPEHHETHFFKGDKGEVHPFTVFPDRDLFILRPRDLNRISCVYFSSPNFKTPWQRPLGPRHIALEYNPEWGVELYRSFDYNHLTHNLIELVYHCGKYTNIWFVDYSLRRCHGEGVKASTHTEGEGVAFYMKGRRFVEIDPFSEDGWNWKRVAKVNGKYVDRAYKYETDSQNFVANMQCILDDPFDKPDYYPFHHQKIGLLACDNV